MKNRLNLINSLYLSLPWYFLQNNVSMPVLISVCQLTEVYLIIVTLLYDTYKRATIYIVRTCEIITR